MLYRDHRGSLAKSMETVREVNSFNELKEYLEKEWENSYKGIHKTVEEIKIEPYSYDKRIDWNTYIVTIRVTGEDNFWVAGFTNGMIE